MAVDIAVATGGVGGILIAAAGGVIASGLNYAFNEIANERPVDGSELAKEAIIGGVSNVFSFGTGGGSLTKTGGNVMKNIVKNFNATLFANTTRFVAGKEVLKSSKGVFKNIGKNIFREVFSSLTETFCFSYSSEVIDYVFDPLS